MPSSPPDFVSRFASHLLRRYSAAEVARLVAPQPRDFTPDPVQAFRRAGMEPDPWQTEFLADPAKRRVMLCCRRAGKSVISAARTWEHCLTEPGRVCLVLSPTQRQSQEYVRYVRRFDRAMDFPLRVVRHNLSETEWSNGSRLISLPDNHEGVVGVGGNPTRLVIDEASRVSDILYMSIRPMLALGAELEVLSTPFGNQGWFFELFNKPQRLAMFRAWRITAAKVPRIAPEFLAEERMELGERWFNQEYFLDFVNAIDAVFGRDVIDAAERDDDLFAPLAL